jgi:hypothetical protein
MCQQGVHDSRQIATKKLGVPIGFGDVHENKNGYVDQCEIDIAVLCVKNPPFQQCKLILRGWSLVDVVFLTP